MLTGFEGFHLAEALQLHDAVVPLLAAETLSTANLPTLNVPSVEGGGEILRSGYTPGTGLFPAMKVTGAYELGTGQAAVEGSWIAGLGDKLPSLETLGKGLTLGTTAALAAANVKMAFTSPGIRPQSGGQSSIAVEQGSGGGPGGTVVAPFPVGGGSGFSFLPMPIGSGGGGGTDILSDPRFLLIAGGIVLMGALLYATR